MAANFFGRFSVVVPKASSPQIYGVKLRNKIKHERLVDKFGPSKRRIYTTIFGDCEEIPTPFLKKEITFIGLLSVPHTNTVIDKYVHTVPRNNYGLQR